MTGQPYSEEQLVEVPASALLAELGWLSVSELDETLGPERPTASNFVVSATHR